MKKRILLFSLLISVSCSAEPLVIQSQDHTIEFDVRLATDDSSRAKGFMFRKSLSPKEGILFVFSGNHQPKMWMKNTLVPLDMLFIDQKGMVVHIHENAEPHSLKTIESPKPVKAVLEIAGGQVQALGIRIGDRINHVVFAAK